MPRRLCIRFVPHSAFINQGYYPNTPPYWLIRLFALKFDVATPTDKEQFDAEPMQYGLMTDLYPIKDGEVDAIMYDRDLNRLDSGEIPEAMSAAYRVLKPGGFVMIGMNNPLVLCEQYTEAIRSGDEQKMQEAHTKLFGDGSVTTLCRSALPLESMSKILLDCGFRDISSWQECEMYYLIAIRA